jgi:DNA-binding NtrC family response regulator
MFKVLVIDSSAEDAESLRGMLTEEGAQVEVRRDGTAARPVVQGHAGGFMAVFMLWDVADTAFAETLALLRHRWPETPVVVMIDAFTPELAAKARLLGAKDTLQKPVEAKKVKACIRELVSARDYSSPMMAELRKMIPGESTSLLAALWQLTRVIPHADSNVLLLGESGTGKELFARAIYKLGRPNAPYVKKQVSDINENLFESQMFGHEKGAFSGAHEQHKGFFEQAGDGTLFLDEIGDLSASGQIRLLRVIQEKKFWRMGGKEELSFNARLVCATHHDLEKEAGSKIFRFDLYQRIGERVVHLPPLRERKGDIEILARHFLNVLNAAKPGRQVTFADETLKILCGYEFLGNVRELENEVGSAHSACVGEIILPQHLSMSIIKGLLRDAPVTKSDKAADAPRRDHIDALIDELARSLPADWLTTAHHEAVKSYDQAFDRVYLPKMLERHKHNLKAAAKAADLDPKTFRKRWRESGLPPLGRK